MDSSQNMAKSEGLNGKNYVQKANFRWQFLTLMNSPFISDTGQSYAAMLKS